MFADQDLLMATALHPNHGISSFDFMAPHMKEEILESVVHEIKALITPENERESNSQGTMEEQEDDRMDAFAELYRAAAPLQSDEEDLEEIIKNDLLAGRGAGRNKLGSRSSLPCTETTGSPSSLNTIQGSQAQLLSSASTTQLRRRPEAGEGISQRGQLRVPGFPKGKPAPCQDKVQGAEDGGGGYGGRGHAFL